MTSRISWQYEVRLIIVFRHAPERIQDLLTSNYENAQVMGPININN